MQTKESQEIVNELLEVLNKNQLNQKEIMKTLCGFLFSIGASFEGVADSGLDAEAVLKMYSEKPTAGSALMAQALYMAETWSID